MKKGNPWALLPILCFLVVFIGMGVWLNDFYAMPAIVGFLIALGVAFCQNRKRSFSEKMEDVTHSMGDSNVMIMCLVFVMAGGFPATVQAAGGVDRHSKLSLSIYLPLLRSRLIYYWMFYFYRNGAPRWAPSLPGPFACLHEQGHRLELVLCIAAVACGAMFGDNLSMISDTTIAATRTQGCELRDKFKVNFWIALPAALITIVVLLIVGRPDAVAEMGDLSFNVIKVLPYVAVLVLALIGMNVFLVLTIGIFAAGIIGLALGDLDIPLFAQSIYNGFTGMNEVFFLSLFCGACLR